MSQSDIVKVSTSDDNSICVWDITNLAAPPAAFPGHEAGTNSVVFTPDAKSLVSGSDDGTVRLWVVDLDTMRDIACEQAGRNMSYGEWEIYLPDSPYNRTCPQWPVGPSFNVEQLVGRGRSLAQAGDVAGAIAKFEEALALDPSLPLRPEGEARRIAAQVFVEQGRSLARDGDMADAAAKFEEALALDPSLSFEPEGEARRIAAQVFVEQGRSLAQDGDVVGAIAKFEEAVALDLSLPIEPEREPGRIAAAALVEQGRSSAQDGGMAGAIAKFEEALALDESLSASPPGYVQVFCALRPGARSVESTEALCSKLYVRISAVVPGESMTGTVATGAIDFWSLDAAAQVTITVDLMADNSPLDAYLYVYAPDGSTVAENDDFADSDSRIEAVLPQAGRYLIGAAGYGDSSGAYRLTLSEAGSAP